jgi:hypothetical protein
MAEHMLTTIDNPFNPFTHPDEWEQYDRASGYNTREFLARVVRTSDELSEADQDLALEQGILEIVTENVSGIYRRITADTVLTR